ncbi:HAMP domain-containing sensor histidine kinase [Clostridium oceanicum]|uniref:histidine kinase n=1 Tax=Clostridium oceanicum TaxID=1543 RepID=A0ABN1JIY8_9CLOT
MKYKKSILKQLFIVTSLVFALFIIIALIGQTVFFKSFYIREKKHEVSKIAEKFKAQYVKEKENLNLENLIEKYEEDSNAKIVILDKKGNIKMDLNSLKDKKFEKRNFFLIHKIINNFYMKFGNLELNEYDKNPVIYTIKDLEPDKSSVVSAIVVKEKKEIVFVFTSLSPVDESVAVIKKMYLSFSIIAMTLVIILSFLYSKMISKPLLKINKVATKMSKLDFSEKCEVKSENELGNLASSLNFLSYNLKKSLDSLKAANLKLEEDIEKERKVERMRKEFIAAASHELKTPISLIEGYAEGIKDKVFDEEDTEYYIDIIIDESKRMGDLVYDMLDLSKIETDNFKLYKEEFFIDELINRCNNKFRGVMIEKNIKVNCKLFKNTKVYGDWNRIDQVITNILTNAIRHIDSRNIINIRMRKLNGFVRVEIENSGKHIEKEEIDKIWDKFYKIDKSRNRQLGGSGIGLAIVKNIIDLHKGYCGAENTEIGVKFYFDLSVIE